MSSRDQMVQAQSEMRYVEDTARRQSAEQLNPSKRSNWQALRRRAPVERKIHAGGAYGSALGFGLARCRRRPSDCAAGAA